MFVKELEASELMAMRQDEQDHLLIDVRSPPEIGAGVIADDALPMPLNLVPLRINEIPKDRQVVFYCRSGARSAQACMYLAQRGYDNVYNLRGGIISWAQSGYPIAPGLSL